MSVGIQKRERVIKNGRNRKNRPKTFKTKQAAEDYAKENKISKYEIENLKNSVSTRDKFRIIIKE